MTTSSSPRPEFRPAGFSLVEVTIALGILAFALTAIMGLLSASLQSSRDGINDTLIAGMSTSLLNTIRKQNLTADPADIHIYFDRSGQRLNPILDGILQPMDVATARAEDAIYDCAVTVDSDPATISADGSANLWRLTLDFRWPIGAANAPNQQKIHADLARY